MSYARKAALCREQSRQQGKLLGSHWTACLLGTGVMAILLGCASSPQQLGRVEANRVGYTHCRGYGCAAVSHLRLSEKEWHQVRGLMLPPAIKPAAERRQVEQAIARLERLSGAKTNTSADRGGTFAAAGRSGQLDCVDESNNTRVYLTLLHNEGLLLWHVPDGLAHRGLLLVGGWPHTTAVMREYRTGEAFAVDSWFLDNGEPPYIVSLAEWQDGWRP